MRAIYIGTSIVRLPRLLAYAMELQRNHRSFPRDAITIVTIVVMVTVTIVTTVSMVTVTMVTMVAMITMVTMDEMVTEETTVEKNIIELESFEDCVSSIFYL